MALATALVTAGCSSSSEPSPSQPPPQFAYPSVAGYRLPASPVWDGVDLRSVDQADGTDIGGLQTWQFAAGDPQAVQQRIVRRDTTSAHSSDGNPAEFLLLAGTQWYLTTRNAGDSLKYASYDRSSDTMVYVLARAGNREPIENFLKAYSRAKRGASGTSSSPAVTAYDLPPSPLWKPPQLRSVETDAGKDLGGMQAWQFAADANPGAQQRMIDRDTVNAAGGDGQAAERLAIGGADWYVSTSANGQSLIFSSYDSDDDTMLYVAAPARNREAIESFLESFQVAIGS